MKAIIFDNSEFKLQEWDQPEPKENEIQVKIAASGFNPVDYQMTDKDASEKKLLHSLILGREFSGIVTALGEKASQFKIGDHIFCGSGSMGSNGTYAEYICIPEEIAMHKPTTISFEEAAAIPSAGLTALQSINRMNAKVTDSILITGAAGGVGNIMVKLLLAKGYENLIVTAGNEKSIAVLVAMGIKPEQIINYKNQDLYEAGLVLNHTKNFDFVVDLVGNEIAFVAARLLKTNGIYVDVTNFSTPDSRQVLFTKGATILNISNYIYGLEKNYTYYKQSLQELAFLLEEKLITPPEIESIGNLEVETVLKAHAKLRENTTQGKKLIMKIV